MSKANPPENKSSQIQNIEKGNFSCDHWSSHFSEGVAVMSMDSREGKTS